jgi:hypothetical protein
MSGSQEPKELVLRPIATVIKNKKTLKEVVREPTLNCRFLSWLLVIGPCPPQGQGLLQWIQLLEVLPDGYMSGSFIL